MRFKDVGGRAMVTVTFPTQSPFRRSHLSDAKSVVKPADIRRALFF
jgi:hypothetical protein